MKGEADDPLLDHTQVQILPGFNVKPMPTTGVELPLTHARAFDYVVRALCV